MHPTHMFISALVLLQLRLALADGPTPSWMLNAQQHDQLPYKGLERDLDKVLQVQSRDKWIALVPFTKGQKDFALNWVYSFTTLGAAENYLMYAFDRESLEVCVGLKLPCYDAGDMLAGG